MNIDNNHWLRRQPIAHRGLHDHGNGIPENSLKAFERAMMAGYAIELDVWVTYDQEVIVFHDATLERACNTKKPVCELTKENLSFPKYRLFNTDERIPLINEVFDLVRGRAPLLIEIKHQPTMKGANMIILNTLLSYKGPFAIQSFDPRILLWFAQKAPYILRGQLSSDFKHPEFKKENLNLAERWVLSKMLLNTFTQPNFISYDHRAVPNPRITRYRRNAVPVIGWTIKNDIERENALNWFDNFIFEGFTIQ